MKLIDLIIHNNSTHYEQGDFANGFNRNKIYEKAKIAQLSSNNFEEYKLNLKNFLISTLDWGNFNLVVGRYHKITSNEIINRIENFDDYAKIFLKTFTSGKSPEEIFSTFENRGELKIKLVGYAYFTKFIHFYSHELSQQLLIMDKWSVLTWAALLIESYGDVKENQIKKINSLVYINKYKKIANKKMTADKYKQFNAFILNLSKNANMAPDRFEEVMFGWSIDETRDLYQNPRLKTMKIIKNYF